MSHKVTVDDVMRNLDTDFVMAAELSAKYNKRLGYNPGRKLWFVDLCYNGKANHGTTFFEKANDAVAFYNDIGDDVCEQEDQ